MPIAAVIAHAINDPRPNPVEVSASLENLINFQQPLPDQEELINQGSQPHAGKRWAQALVRAVGETIAGQRSPAQLTRWTTEAVLDVVSMHASTAHRIGVRGLRMQEPLPGILEVAAHLTDDHRSRAMALRIESDDERTWLCTALQIG